MNACCFATTADGVLSVCQAEGTDEFVASFLPRLEGGTLNEAGIISLGAFETPEAARQALIQRYRPVAEWLDGHPDALHLLSHIPNVRREAMF